MAPALARHHAQNAAAVIAFPARQADSALVEAIKSHRLPGALESALLREAALCGGGRAGLARALAARLRPLPLDLARARTIFLFGPSGAGKSAVAGKIAQAARTLGREARIVAAAKGLAHTATTDDQLIIADCAGFNPRNAKARAAFGALGAAPSRDSQVQAIAIVSALGDAQEISELAAALALRRVIVTGLDMTRRAGALAAACLQGAALVHVTRGPGPEAGLETLTAPGLAALLTAPVAIPAGPH